MRELKFRAWSEENKLFYYDAAIENGEVVLLDYDFSFNGWSGVKAVTIDDAIIEQYTGLKDKNGKEIYEGDIVEYSWDFCGEKLKSRYVVKWLSVKIEHYPYSVDSGFTLPDSEDGYEVIGNIHENAELLENSVERRKK